MEGIEILKKYKVKSIRTKSGMAVLGKTAEVVDEGRLFRIADMYVVDKGNVVNVEKNGENIRIDYKNGDWFEIGICEEK